MRRSIIATCLLLLVVCPGYAQTTGVALVNDLTVNGSGSSMTGCNPVSLVAGAPLSLETSSFPDAQIIAFVGNGCLQPPVFVTPSLSTYYLDVIPPLDYLFDGSGMVLAPTALTQFFRTNTSGDFTFLVTAPEIMPVDVYFQQGLVHPTFPDGFGTTQAWTLDFSAATLCPNTVGGDLSPLSDDGSINVTLSAPFSFYGTVHSDVFVNMNGNLTFTLGSSDFSPTETEFLNDVPRIAPCWDDFSPNVQGTVRASDLGGVFEVEWHDVPAFGVPCTGGVDSNTFCASLDLASGAVSMGFGGMMFCIAGGSPSADQIVGVPPGLGSSGPNNVDLSAGNPGAPGLALYEDFGQALFTPFDLAHLTSIQGQRLVFTPAAGGFSVSLQ